VIFTLALFCTDTVFFEEATGFLCVIFFELFACFTFLGVDFLVAVFFFVAMRSEG